MFAGLAWVPPLLLSLVAGQAFGPAEQRPFLLDLGAWTRFLLAISIFILMERSVEQDLRKHLRQLVRAPLLSPSAMPAAAEAVLRALRRRDNALAEALCLLAAIAVTALNLMNSYALAMENWMLSIGSSGASLTVAGWWAVVVSNPIFWFLFFRWVWRQIVWGLLLRELAGLEFRLVVNHPDKAGGLAFLSHYPSAFTGFVFAASCVLGAAIARALWGGAVSVTAYGYLMTAWLAIVMVYFALPLLAFSKPLKRLKEETLLLAGASATQFYRAQEREVLGRNVMANAAEQESVSPEAKARPDPTKLHEAADKLSTLLFSRSAITSVAVAAVIPLIIAGATQLPIRDLLKAAKGLILL